MEEFYEFSFERLGAWKLARQLVRETYVLLRKFPKDELFGMTDQAKRAVVSVPTNLAEGSSRSSMKERNHYYQISFGSLIELLNLMILAHDLDYITNDEYSTIRKKIHVVSIVITGLSKSTKPPS